MFPISHSLRLARKFMMILAPAYLFSGACLLSAVVYDVTHSLPSDRAFWLVGHPLFTMVFYGVVVRVFVHLMWRRWTCVNVGVRCEAPYIKMCWTNVEILWRLHVAFIPHRYAVVFVYWPYFAWQGARWYFSVYIFCGIHASNWKNINNTNETNCDIWYVGDTFAFCSMIWVNVLRKLWNF